MLLIIIIIAILMIMIIILIMKITSLLLLSNKGWGSSREHNKNKVTQMIVIEPHPFAMTILWRKTIQFNYNYYLTIITAEFKIMAIHKVTVHVFNFI